MATKKAEEKKTYILTLKDGGIRKVTVPATWKMTYGSVAPWQNKGMDSGPKVYALRFYEGSEKNLRAVFTDVVSLRDESIEIVEKRTSIKRQVLQKNTRNGARDVHVEARVSEWVNPDKEESDSVSDEFLQIGQATNGSDF